MSIFMTLVAAIQSVPQPDQGQLEDALTAHYLRIATYPAECKGQRPAPTCLKPPKRIKVRNFACRSSGTGAADAALLFCRVTYIHSGGSLAHVLSTDECVPLRGISGEATFDGQVLAEWEVALVDAKGKCAGGR